MTDDADDGVAADEKTPEPPWWCAEMCDPLPDDADDAPPDAEG